MEETRWPREVQKGLPQQKCVHEDGERVSRKQWKQGASLKKTAVEGKGGDGEAEKRRRL
jgi:hypothetical protein